mgnify:CR=1 FL=1
MIFTRKHIVIAVLFAVVGIAIGIGIKHYETLQTFSSICRENKSRNKGKRNRNTLEILKYNWDAPHGACGKCFKETMCNRLFV